MGTGQTCTTVGCTNEAAYKTRTKPAWCRHCLEGILNGMDLESAEPFLAPREQWLIRCRVCQAECHYFLKYLLELRERDEPACRRCFWIQWSANMPMGAVSGPAVDIGTQAAHLAENSYVPVEELFALPWGEYPILTRCRYCGRQKAQRMGDIGWGCSCVSNPNSGAKRVPGGPKKKNLLIDSDSPALAWWDAEANDKFVLNTVTGLAHRLCAWVCPQCGHHFEAKVRDMAERPTCPPCEDDRRAAWRAEHERLKNTPISEIPELLMAWDDDANPWTETVAGSRLRKFKCQNGHHPRVRPYSYYTSGCPSCRGAVTLAADKPMLSDALPEIAGQWHPTLNGKWTPAKVGPDSKRLVWWLASCCGHEWQEEVRQRIKRPRYLCPRCNTILDSLAMSDPGMAAEWSHANPATAWQVRPAGATDFMPAWNCSVNPEHQWEASLASRYAGSDCPECRQAGKSKIELDHFEAARKTFGSAKSGPKLCHKAFALRKHWTADIVVESNGAKVAIEYDGSYWHAPEAKKLVDEAKSRDLLAAGYVVVRLREDNLPGLGIHDTNYLELQVYSVAPRPEETMAEVVQWLAAVSMSGMKTTTEGQ